MWIKFNPNPAGNSVGDCVIRGICAATGQSWDESYIGVVLLGLEQKDMPSSNRIWGEYLRRKGYKRFVIPDTCPNCYTISDFCEDHPNGQYVLATGTHVVTAIDGDYFDNWDSGGEVPVYYWRKG